MSAREGMAKAGREAEVLGCLASVTDPELDEPVTDLGFVEAVTVGADGDVSIDFRLPTFWCAANFAYMMAEDMRDAVAALPWVTRVVPRLQEHMCADEVNRGVAQGLAFGAAFGEAGDDNSLANLRATFRRKAFQGRQEALLRALLAQGLDKARLVGMTVAELERTAVSGHDGANLQRRYREMRARVGGPAGPDDRAFVTAEGAPLTEADFDEHLRTLASVRIAMEFNGALCRGLLAARERASGAPQT
ncbi:MAG: iron-sulfur cluster assembly protein [Rhodospirillaceae bacterium]|nr:iron-sulfur cluster assembly protein [Rhodospirillaceae bacterium]